MYGCRNVVMLLGGRRSGGLFCWWWWWRRGRRAAVRGGLGALGTGRLSSLPLFAGGEADREAVSPQEAEEGDEEDGEDDSNYSTDGDIGALARALVGLPLKEVREDAEAVPRLNCRARRSRRVGGQDGRDSGSWYIHSTPVGRGSARWAALGRKRG